MGNKSKTISMKDSGVNHAILIRIKMKGLNWDDDGCRNGEGQRSCRRFTGVEDEEMITM